MIAYLLQMIACSGILYGYYHFFLRNEKFHQYNRFYLLAIVILSLLLPLFKIQVYFEDNADIIYQSLGSLNEGIVVVSNKATASWLNATTAVYLVYAAIALFFMIRIIAALQRILRIKSEGAITKTDGIIFIDTTHQEAPFSFFRWLFWNKNISLNSTEGEHIFRHEMYHISKKHTYDLMFTELITALFWFNPIFYLVKNEVKAIQEFLADKHATEEQDACGYAELLLMQAIGSYKYKLVNPFFHNQLKRRIAMLTSSKKPGYQWLRKLSVLPIAALTIATFGFTYKTEIKEVIASVPKITTRMSPDISVNDETRLQMVTTMAKTDTIPSDKETEVDPARIVSANYRTGSGRYRKLNPITVVSYTDTEVPKMVLKEGEMKIDVDARFPGNWNNFIERNINGQVPTYKGASAGIYEVLVRFVVNEDGSLSDFTPVTNEGYGMEEEVIRVLKKSPVWNPAINNKDGGQNKKVKSYRLQPVNFQVLNKKEGIFTPPAIIKDKSSTEREPEVFTKVAKDASYPGNWRSFLERNLNGQVAVDNGAGVGTYTTIVQFIVDKDGNTSNFKALTNHGYGMEEEALRVIKTTGKWKPAIQNGRAVKAYRKQPITFQITDA